MRPVRRHAYALLAVSHVFASTLATAQDARPQALVRMEQARLNIPAARFRWTTEYHNKHPGFPIRHRAQLARNGDQFFELLGDTKGETEWDAAGKAVSHAPHMLLATRDGLWSRRGADHVVTTTSSAFAPQRTFYLDTYPEFWNYGNILALGVTEMTALPPRSSVVWEPDTDPPEAITWKEEYDANQKIYRVTKTYESGRFVTWYIDPEKGWNAERILTKPSPASASSVEVVATLEKFGETWFPRVVVRYLNGVPDYTTVVESAVFDPPDAPESLPISLLNIPVGATIESYDGNEMKAVNYWDGKQALPRPDFDAAVRSGRIKISPELLEGAARGFVDSKWLTDEERTQRRATVAVMRKKALYTGHETIWERYVRTFIARYSLNEEQAQRAWQIHNDCRDRAREYIDRHKSQFEETEERMQVASLKGKPEEIEGATEKARELLKPVTAIFEEQLKPRLETLPTRAQREAAEKPPASKPAPQPDSSPG